jgi:capsid protein
MVLSHVDPVKDIAESTIMMDRGINSDPDYIIQAKSNYDDIYIPIEDETGKSKNYPLFQH